MTLGVVADVDEHLRRLLGHLDPLEEPAGGGPLLDDRREPDSGGTVGIAHCIGAALGDPCQEGLGSERPIHARIGAEAIASYSTHKGSGYELLRMLLRRLGRTVVTES
jgi:hypothetical protein